MSATITKSKYGSIAGVRTDIANKIKKDYLKVENKLNLKIMNIHDLIENKYYTQVSPIGTDSKIKELLKQVSTSSYTKNNHVKRKRQKTEIEQAGFQRTKKGKRN